MHSQKVASTAKITETRSLFRGFFGVVGQAFFCPSTVRIQAVAGALPKLPSHIKIGANTKLLSMKFQNTL